MEDNGPKYDPFTVAPYISALAAFQGWNAILLYGYSQDGLRGSGYSMWSVYNHPQSMALAPAAALFPVQSDGSRGTAIPLELRDGTYTIILPTDKQTHWFVLDE